MKGLLHIFAVGALFLLLPNALADVPYDQNYFSLQDVEIEAIDDEDIDEQDMAYMTFAYNGSCSGKKTQNPSNETLQPKMPPLPTPVPGKPVIPGQVGPIVPRLPTPTPTIPPLVPGVGSGLPGNLGTIVNIGKMIWNIVESNKPVTNITTERAYAMPSGITCWTDLEHWNRPRTRTYGISYKNLYGATVASLKMKVVYYYNGQYRGKGAFLANVTVVPKQVEVKWGFKLHVQVVTEEPINLSSQDDPIAGLGIGVTWKVESVLTDKIQTLDLFVDGKGNLDQI